MKVRILIASLSVALALAACQTKIDKAEESFVDGCHAQGAETSVCSCIFDQLKAHYGAEQLLEFNRRLASDLPPDFVETAFGAGVRCRS
ncbi:conserved exported hypothetical protein [Burkholderia sp. 8Y]|nr:conserved exported hypothetical protein [Burkholderia sp. 8Y]